MVPPSRTDDDIRGLDAHQIVPVPAAVQFGRETVRVAEAGLVQFVADAAGVGEVGLAHLVRKVLAERLLSFCREVVVRLLHHPPADVHQFVEFVGSEVEVMSDP